MKNARKKNLKIFWPKQGQWLGLAVYNQYDLQKFVLSRKLDQGPKAFQA